MPEAHPRKRPFGLVIIIALQLISAVSLVVDIFFASTHLSFAAFLENLQVTVLPFPGTLLLVYQLVVIAGLWFLRRWAWFLLMIQLGLSMGFQLFLYFEGRPLYIYMLISVITVLYLNQRDVQHAFERGNQPRSHA
jgi:uncharacterized membrane protein (DUF2068 family)